ncbi:hypothetical protein [Nonomuraea typhae]|uniref:Uncharacterized protein n=1 Tax=Nonomuraea typhae TaxID=2603600 RepID=A0ABW7YWR1_9ACTN
MDETTPPVAGMVISVRTRRDVVVMDPEKFLAAARTAYKELYAGEEADVVDVVEAVNVLLDRYGRLADDVGEMPLGPGGSRPGERVQGRADGVSPAGQVSQIVIGETHPLQDYGCFAPEDPFKLPPAG